jgi:hypothetical protein
VPAELALGLAALTAGDAEAAVRQLIGVGTGSVPLGDGVLAGALAALTAWAPDSTARQDFTVAVAESVGRTTLVSAALLRSVVAGFATPELNRYLTALSSSGISADSALAELTVAGNGSGAATALGVVRQLQALRR